MSEGVRPTKKQRELLGFIEAFITQHGYSPSYREIMTGLDYTSVATVSLHVNSLIKRGHLLKRDGKARSLEVAHPTMTSHQRPEAVTESDEKWLVQKVEQLFTELEAEAEVVAERLDGLFVLVGALRVLGFDGAAQSFVPRLTALKQRASEAEL